MHLVNKEGELLTEPGIVSETLNAHFVGVGNRVGKTNSCRATKDNKIGKIPNIS